MTKIEIPKEAGPLVLAGGLFAIWGMSQQQQQNTSTVHVTVSANGTPVSGTVDLSGLPPQTGSDVTFFLVPYGSYVLTVTGTAYPDYSQSITVNQPSMGIGVNLNVQPPPAAVALSGGTATASTIAFTSVVSQATGSVPITYVYAVHNPSGQAVQAGHITDPEADGSYNLTINLSPVLAAGTYEFIVFPTDSLGSSIGNKLDFTQAVTGGGGIHAVLSRGVYNAAAQSISWQSVITGSPTAQQVVYNDAIHNSAGQVVQTGTVQTNEGNGTFHPFTGISTQPAGTYSVRVFATDSAGGSISNTLAFNFTVTGVGVPHVEFSNGAATATNITFRRVVTNAPAFVTGVKFLAFLHDSAGTVVANATQTTSIINGTQNHSYSWNTTVSAAGTYHATLVANDSAGTLISNVLTASFTISGPPPLFVVIHGATGNANSITASYTVSGAVSGGSLITLNAQARLGSVNSVGKFTFRHTDGTFTDSVPLGTLLGSGTYAGSVYATDSTGSSISGTLNFTFTV